MFIENGKYLWIFMNYWIKKCEKESESNTAFICKIVLEY